jgi:hypothetical protein
MHGPTSSLLIGLLDQVVSADLRDTLRSIPGEVAHRTQLWRQRALLVHGEGVAPFKIGFAGDPDHLPGATDLLRLIPTVTEELSLNTAMEPETALFSDWPMPGALRLPVLLRTLIPLASTCDESMTGLASELRRRCRRLFERASVRQVTRPEEVTQIHETMMKPFAEARHDDRAEVVPESELQRIAREDFLAVITLDGVPVAAQSGHPYLRNGQRCWEALRYGYPKEVFSDPSKMSDANALNSYVSMHHAISQGYEVLDFGTSIAAPEGGLLQFKRRRGGALSVFGCPHSLWLRPPKQDTASFFWRYPLFSVERRGLVLNVGVPENVQDAELLARLKSLGYGGLEAVKLHTARPLSAAVQAAASELFSSPRGAVHGKGSANHLEVVHYDAQTGEAPQLELGQTG